MVAWEGGAGPGRFSGVTRRTFHEWLIEREVRRLRALAAVGHKIELPRRRDMPSLWSPIDQYVFCVRCGRRRSLSMLQLMPWSLWNQHPWLNATTPCAGQPGQPVEEPKPTVVLGQQVTEAREAEDRHRASAGGQGTSPLEGVVYDRQGGHRDLLRFVPTDIDVVVGEVVARFVAADGTGREAMRADLTMDDFYTLLDFARRAALRALRADDPRIAVAGLVAVAMVDPARVDPRDIPGPAGLCAGVFHGLDAEGSAAVERIVGMCAPRVDQMMSRFVNPTAQDLEPSSWLFRRTDTPDGPGFVRTWGHPYNPTLDLIEIGLRIALLLESDHYRTAQVESDQRIPPIWLRAIDKNTATPVLNRCRGAVVVSADLDPQVAADNDTVIWIAEAADRGDADRIYRWGIDSEPLSNRALLTVQDQQVVALMVCRSVLRGQPQHETNDTLRRFAQPIQDILGS